MDDPLLRPLPSRLMSQRVREWLVWFGIGRLAVVAVSVVAVGAGGYWLLQPPPTPVESSLPRAAAATSAPAPTSPSSSPPADRASADPSSTTAVPTVVVVHVAGQVMAPGVYTLPPGARVVDAIDRAGGVLATATADAINLAEPLRDGDRVYVPSIDDASGVPAGVTSSASPGPEPGASSSPAGPIDLNAATIEQLDALPGVGPSTAAAIIAHRQSNGPFASVDDLDAVRGIGPAKLEALRDLVTV
jgi:competence protein ComEA